MKEYKELSERCGKENPFRIPEGYFESFHNALMENLPEVETVVDEPVKLTVFARLKPWLYLAAMFVSTIFVVQALMYVQESKFSGTGSEVAAADFTEEEIEHFMATSLYDEYALYSYLTNNENN